MAKAALQRSCSSAYPSLNPEFCHQNMLRDAVGDFMCVTTNDDLYQLLISGGPLGSHVSHMFLSLRRFIGTRCFRCHGSWGDGVNLWNCNMANQEPYDIIQVSLKRTLFWGPWYLCSCIPQLCRIYPAITLSILLHCQDLGHQLKFDATVHQRFALSRNLYSWWA